MQTPTRINRVSIPARLYFRIGDVAELLGIKPYVLRYWESEFPMISPEKASSGQRVYRRKDVEALAVIKHLLYEERYSIEGARKKIKELRKEGEFQSLKEEVTLLPAPAASVESSIDSNSAMPLEESGAADSARSLRLTQQLVEIQILVDELKTLAQKPINQLFFF